eukprot:scaffold54929_cov27-Phaeocystis_antarctica.AAC.1
MAYLVRVRARVRVRIGGRGNALLALDDAVEQHRDGEVDVVRAHLPQVRLRVRVKVRVRIRVRVRGRRRPCSRGCAGACAPRPRPCGSSTRCAAPG